MADAYTNSIIDQQGISMNEDPYINRTETTYQMSPEEEIMIRGEDSFEIDPRLAQMAQDIAIMKESCDNLSSLFDIFYTTYYTNLPLTKEMSHEAIKDFDSTNFSR